LVLVGRRQERLDALAESVSVPALTLALDVRDRQAVEHVIGDLPSDFAAIDLLVNNAGLALGLSGAQDADLDDWDQMIDTNVKGLVYVARAVLPGMVARDRGHIVNIGSVAGSYPYPGGNVYGGTKAFVHQFSLNLKADLLGTRVRVTSLEPGMTVTEFSEVRFKGDADKAAEIYSGADALPAHVNVNVLEVMPVCQAFSPFAIDRTG
jgi:NADP-dependent 3-hydroxy acid dehydrogenase YdfG